MFDPFADHPGNVAIASGVARLDFLRMANLDPEEKQIRMKSFWHHVMPNGRLVQTVDMPARLVDTAAMIANPLTQTPVASYYQKVHELTSWGSASISGMLIERSIQSRRPTGKGGEKCITAFL